MATQVKLPLLMFKDVSLRVLIIKDCGQGVYQVKHPQPRVINTDELGADEMPIFLARDVCGLIDEPGKNSGAVTRFTRKMQNWKLNTKVQFSDACVEGINNSSVLNFVNIEALYIAAFHSNNTDVQSQLVPCLTKVWQAHCTKTLPEHIKYCPINTAPTITAEAPQRAENSNTQLFDDILKSLDTSSYQIGYISDFRSLLNSYRSLCLKLSSASFSQVLQKEEELTQSLIASDLSSGEGIQEAVLDVASCWIGREFRSLRPLIQKKVTTFKTENISSISKLPSAKEICQLFPKAMVSLFEHWLYSYNDCERSGGACEPPSKRVKHSESDIYPFIQLLLEFSNNTLISGVAHVVYTQLLRDPT